MAGAGITGRDGDAKIGGVQISEVTKWGFTPKVNVVSYASNKTAGFKQRIAGVKEGSGTLEGVWDPANPAYTLLTEGIANLALKLYINATQFWAVTAMIESFSGSANIDAGEIVPWSAAFFSQGLWTGPVAGMMLPEGALPQNLIDDGSIGRVILPNAPLQYEGEDPVEGFKRYKEMMEKLELPESAIERISARVIAQSTSQYKDMIEEAAERAAGRLSASIVEQITQAIMTKLNLQQAA